jgi:predicted phage terminase large subunit-like protein
MVRLANGRQLPRDRAEAYLELLREQHRRREAKRLETEREAILAKCATLHGFIEEFWYVLEPAVPFVTGWAIRAMCDHLEAVHNGWIQNLLITVPPGTMKSLLVSVFFQAWEWGPKGRPDLRYLATSFSEENVTRDSNKVRKLLESEKYRALWGDEVKPGQRWGVYNFENTKGGNRDCRPFGSLTGGRGDRVLIDDPHSVKMAESDTQRAETVKQYREGATDRLNDITKSATIVIMQRLHRKDVAGEIIDLDVGFVHLNLPMEFEPKRRCVTVLRPANDGNPAILFQDPRQADGELLFPERFPAAEVARLKKLKGSYAWAGQYQQRPAPRDGGMFKRSDFAPIRALPAGARFCRGWDFAATEGAGDFTAGVKIAAVPDGRYVIVNVVRGQWGPGNVAKNLLQTTALDGVDCRVRIPQDPAAAGKTDAQAKIKLLSGYSVRAKPVSGDKEQRADPFATQVEAGNVWILVTGEAARDAWIEPFLEEIEEFPGSAHDDQVDAVADAFNELALGPGPATALFGRYVGRTS